MGSTSKSDQPAWPAMRPKSAVLITVPGDSESASTRARATER